MLYLCKPRVTSLLGLTPEACEETHAQVLAGRLKPTWVSFDHKLYEDHKFNLYKLDRLRKVLDNLDKVIFVSFAVSEPEYPDKFDEAEMDRLIEVGLKSYHRITLQTEDALHTSIASAVLLLNTWTGVKMETHLTVPLKIHAQRWHIDHAGSEDHSDRLNTISPGTFNYPYRGAKESYVQADNQGHIQSADLYREACYFINPRDVKHRVEFEEPAPERRVLMFRQLGFDVDQLAQRLRLLGLLEAQ